MQEEKRKVVIYIAMSLDGYIAGEDGDISWLSMVERPGEDYGYKQFEATVDTVIMGRKTYEKILSFGIEFPHKDKACYVLSRTLTGKDENVIFRNGEISGLISELRRQEGRNIYCDGGAEVIFELMKSNLVDRFIISIIPVLIGKGISLFKSGRKMQELILIHCQSYPGGLVQLWYERKNG